MKNFFSLGHRSVDLHVLCLWGQISNNEVRGESVEVSSLRNGGVYPVVYFENEDGDHLFSF